MDKLKRQSKFTVENVNNSGSLEFSKIDIDADYRKKWNINENDFFCLTKNGKLVRETLYRKGGLNFPNLKADSYFQLLKHVEAHYSDKILKMSKSDKPRHLESRWCILDKEGNEKVELEAFQHAYLINDSQIYSVNSKYYNVANGEFYCDSNKIMQSKEFIFLENTYDEDKSKRGIMKINKKNGEWELIP